MASEPNRCATPDCDGMDAFQLVREVQKRDAEIERQGRVIAKLRSAIIAADFAMRYGHTDEAVIENANDQMVTAMAYDGMEE